MTPDAFFGLLYFAAMVAVMVYFDVRAARRDGGEHD